MAVAGRRQALHCNVVRPLLVSLLSLSLSSSLLHCLGDRFLLSQLLLFILLPLHYYVDTCFFFCSFDLYSLSTPRSGAVRSLARVFLPFQPVAYPLSFVLSTTTINDHLVTLSSFFNTGVNKLHTLGFEERESSAGSISRGACLKRTETRIYTHTPP